MIAHDRISPENNRESARGSSSTGRSHSDRPGISALLRDALALVELQGKLFVHDLHQFRTGSGSSLLMLVIGVVLAFATVPVMLLGMAWMLASLAGWPVWVATITVAVTGGVGPAVGLLVVGWKSLQRKASVMSRTTTELRRNTDWLKKRLQSSL